MQAYLAIFKRDAQLQPLNFPMPLFALLVTIVLLLLTNAVVTGILLLWGCLFCSTLLVNELKVGHAHQLAFVLPHFKVIQFNYSLALCTVMALAAGILLASNISEAIFWSVFAMFWISLVFLLVNHRAILLVLSFIISVILFTIILTLIDGTIVVKHLVRFVAEIFAPFGEARLFVAAVILALISIYNLCNSRRRYLNYRQYQARDLPGNWQATASIATTQHASISRALLPHKIYQGLLKAKEAFNNWLRYGSNRSLLAQASFDPSLKSQSLVELLGILIFIPLFLFFLSITSAMGGIDALIFLIFGLISVTSVSTTVAKEFLRQQNLLASTWLLHSAKSRHAYSSEILTVFALRYFRVISLVLILLTLSGFIFLDSSTLSRVLKLILLCAFFSGVLAAIAMLLIAVKWPSSVWAPKILAGVTHAPYLIFMFLSVFKLSAFSLVSAAVVFGILICSLIFSMRYWRNNGLQLLA